MTIMYELWIEQYNKHFGYDIFRYLKLTNRLSIFEVKFMLVVISAKG